MKRNIIRSKLIAVAALMFILVLSLFTYVRAMASDGKMPDEIYFLLQMESFLRANYVGEIDDLELLRGAVKGMVESLNDPYSEYFTPSEFMDYNEYTSGNYEGIGVVITLRDKYITVVSVFSGSPAEKAGIKPGDRFIEIDGNDITGLSTAEVTKRLAGEKGTKVNIVVIRNGETLRFVIERDIVKINPIEFTVLGKGIGYIKINQFNANTVENLDKALDIFKKSGVLGIVLDLRNNPGGYVEQAIEAAKRFVSQGPIVNIVNKDGDTQTFTSDSEPSPFKLVVLVNGGSASAAEILAGAIKDRNVGLLVGERTFGKGMVQRTLSLGSLGGIKLTTAYYTTPNGTNIHNTGITPDIVVETDKSDPLKEFVPITNHKTLNYGNIGLEVLGVQQRLRFLGLFNAEPDGVFGPRTLQAVKELQKQASLSVNGTVDSNFYVALNNAIIQKLASKEDIQLRKAIDVLLDMLKSKSVA